MSENNTKLIGTSCVIATELDIYDIENPYEGLFVYVRDTRKVYVVTQVEAYAVNGSHAGYKVVAYNQIQGALLNYRGEYVAANTPKAPVEGDWYRNTTYGRTYIMQDGAWRFMTQDGDSGINGIDGEKGDKGDKGDKGEKGEKGDPGTSLSVKGVLPGDDLNGDGIPDKLPGSGDSAPGDAYIIDGDLWVYSDQNGWINCGKFTGEPGESNYIDFRYSNDITTKQFTDNYGKAPGVYFGVVVTNYIVESNTPAEFDKYTWTELRGASVKQVFIRLAEGTIPTTPIGQLSEVLSQGWEEHPNDVASDGVITWMSTTEMLGDKVITNWTAPIRLTGKDGVFGEDGDGIQFAFIVTNSDTIVPEYAQSASQDDNYYMKELGWSDDTKGISSTLRYEWVSIRTKRDSVWSAYSKPVVWSSWGEDGVDGGGTEYIYYRTQTYDAGIFDNTEIFNPVKWAKQPNYATYDWVPESAGWTDNPEGVDPMFTCEWVSKRTYAPNLNGDLVFGQFGTPALWAKWATDGASALTLSLTNDNTFIVCDFEGNELNVANRPTTNLSVYIGSSNVTSDCEFTVTCNKEGVSATISKNDDNASATLTIDVAEGVAFKDKVLFDITATYKVDEDTEYQGYKRFIVTAITDVNYVYYELDTNANIVKRDKFGEEYPDLLVASVYKFTPQNRTRVLDLAAEGLVLKYEIDNDTVEHVYNSAIDCGSIENTITFRLYMPDGSVDEESIEVLQDGVDGTSISLENSVANEEERLQLSVEAGTVVYQADTGELWLWDGTTWQNLGKIKGEPGDSQYIHIKYATGTVGNLVWTDNEGETPGPWMGVYADNNRADAYDKFVVNTPYVWSNIKGADGANAEFKYYRVHPSVNQVVAVYNQTTGKFESMNPSKIYMKLDEFTQDGKRTIDLIDGLQFALVLFDKDGNQLSIASAEGMTEFDISSILNTAYIEARLYESATMTLLDMERISVLWQLTGVTATMPDWIEEWDTNAQFNGQHVLAVSAYIGDKPVEGEMWSGLLMGSSVAYIEGLPWHDDSQYSYDFSGILAVKNFDPSVGDNILGENSAEVSFALDAKTGDAYFNGIVYATDGKFTGEIEATSGKFENGVITNSTVSNLTVSNSSDDYNVIIGGDQAGDRAFTINGVNIRERFQSAVVTASAPFVQEGDLLDSSADLVLPDSTLDRVELDFTNKTANIYNTIANAIARDPYFVVKTTEEHPIQGIVTVYYPAEVSQNGSSYDVGFNRKSMSLAPIVEINCDTQGKTGSISVTSYEAVDGIYSRTTMNGGSFAVEYNESASFGDDTFISSVSVVDNGIKILGIPTCATTNTHNYDKGVLYVDENGIVRVSDGEGSYIKATVL